MILLSITMPTAEETLKTVVSSPRDTLTLLARRDGTQLRIDRDACGAYKAHCRSIEAKQDNIIPKVFGALPKTYYDAGVWVDGLEVVDGGWDKTFSLRIDKEHFDSDTLMAGLLCTGNDPEMMKKAGRTNYTEEIAVPYFDRMKGQVRELIMSRYQATFLAHRIDAVQQLSRPFPKEEGQTAVNLFQMGKLVRKD